MDPRRVSPFAVAMDGAPPVDNQHFYGPPAYPQAQTGASFYSQSGSAPSSSQPLQYGLYGSAPPLANQSPFYVPSEPQDAHAHNGASNGGHGAAHYAPSYGHAQPPPAASQSPFYVSPDEAPAANMYGDSSSAPSGGSSSYYGDQPLFYKPAPQPSSRPRMNAQFSSRATADPRQSKFYVAEQHAPMYNDAPAHGTAPQGASADYQSPYYTPSPPHAADPTPAPQSSWPAQGDTQPIVSAPSPASAAPVQTPPVVPASTPSPATVATALRPGARPKKKIINLESLSSSSSLADLSPVAVVQRERCSSGASCIDTTSHHLSTNTHACVYQGQCRTQTEKHRSDFTHDDEERGLPVRLRCTSNINCPSISTREHYIKHLHDCYQGANCTNTDRDHRLCFVHAGATGAARARELCPQGNCKDNSEAHVDAYMHICADHRTGCPRRTDAHHAANYAHETDYCSLRLSCPDINDPQHRHQARHYCPKGLSCGEKGSMLHTLYYRHVSPNLTECKRENCSPSLADPHVWENSHACAQGRLCNNRSQEHLFCHTHTQDAIRSLSSQAQEQAQPMDEVIGAGSQEYNMVKSAFESSLQNKTIVQIKRLACPGLNETYNHMTKNRKFNGNTVAANEALLVYVPLKSGVLNVDDIVKEGFYYRNQGVGVLGEGNHFSTQLSDAEARIPANGGVQTMIVAKVARGNVYPSPGQNTALKISPSGYQSVSLGNITCIYSEAEAVPAYVLQYK